jgi:type III pantothenate kinase
MFLLIDAGNTRIKFGCHDGARWRSRSVLEEGPLVLPAGFLPRQTVVSCVAGPHVRDRLQQVLAGLGGDIEWLSASPERCGLRCEYDAPAALGPDRWAAALGAWQRVGGPCVVMSAGTATTIDVIRAPGVYDGGCILQIGALREVCARLAPYTPIILTGGAAPDLLPLLGDSVRHLPWLTLDGLLSVARDRRVGA